MKQFNYDKAFKRASNKHYRYDWDETKEQSIKVKSPETFKFAMRWYPRLGLFKYKARSTCTFNPYTMEAKSYDWWCFLMLYKGKIIFNEYSYSHTTSGHQSMVRQLLRQLGIKVDIYMLIHNVH